MHTLFVLSWLLGGCLGLEVRQSHSDLITNPGDKVHIFCSHEKTNYYVMLWYQQSPGDTAMKLIGFLNVQADTVEESYKEDFNIAGDLGGSTAKNGSLIIKGVKENHSAVYYCAAPTRDKLYEAYFGQGTKLTVLESGRRAEPPTVKVLPPSLNECRNKKDSKRKKTLVCVASKFYPDHVSVFWQIDGDNVTEGVATDDAALRPEGGRNYTITSRLRVSAESWFTPTREFKCLVQFYNGKDYEIYEDSINGVEAPAKGNAITREKYLRVTQTAKLSYAVFIVKSSIYGAFVAFLVWKLQGKQNN